MMAGESGELSGKRQVSWGVGRRKTSVAKVRLIANGQGKVVINRRTLPLYFSKAHDRKAALQPLELTGLLQNFDVYVDAFGGGTTGQAAAMSLGVARALVVHDPALRSALSREQLLTRDSRMVERKKYGQRGARRRYQYSKR